ncbi:hypothetical protein [Sunxiuqinia elliptica]|uniref:Uncharacterized protein n=1 Tax=Sunxiuqinia elliptica TaxID=655355 RepID=A0A4R6H0A1_9BACT|nr:hypothetical protein [Sunxiuqinia elliptica]TDO01382.1 hypothetical protein DET52_105241 [Sunxiuqinia elliptica]TDO57893.1 hypothetical protein DET65_3490 [Sunxiuqinia elliptica]
MEDFYRKILSAAIFQHSSKVQPFKQSSLDRIIERIIMCSEHVSLTIEEIQKSFIETIGYSIPVGVIEAAIERLIQHKSLIFTEDGK